MTRCPDLALTAVLLLGAIALGAWATTPAQRRPVLALPESEEPQRNATKL